MATSYYIVLTSHGSTKLAQAQAGTPFQITSFVMGDANGQPYLPDSRIDATALVNERARLPVDSVIPVSPNLVKVMVTIPADVGGFNQQEIGLLDETGQLVYLGNFHGGYRPAIGEGASGVTTLEMDLATTGLGTIILQVNPNIVYATEAWVNENFVTIPTFNANQTAVNTAIAQAKSDAEAYTDQAKSDAENYSHNEDIALAAALQTSLDNETAQRQTLATTVTNHMQDDATKFQNLQDEIAALGGAYPRQIAAGYYASISNQTPSKASSSGWSHDVSSINLNGTGPAGSAAVNCSPAIDLTNSKYLIRATGYCATSVPFGDSSSQVVVSHPIPTPNASGFTLDFSTIGTISASPPNYMTNGIYFSWEVIQLTA